MNDLRFLIASIVSLGLGGLTSCAAPSSGNDPPAETIRSAIVGGTVTSVRPEIGNSPGCTATLIAPRWVITASHCIGFSTSNPASYSYSPGVTPTSLFAVQQIFNLGPNSPTTIPPGNSQDDFGRNNLLETTDSSGVNDIALFLLANPVPSTLVPIPAAIATSLPAVGSTVTDFGFGCTSYTNPNSVDGKKRFASWTFSTPGSAGQRLSAPNLINSDGMVVPAPGGQAPNYKFATGGHVCPGDSGGPVVTGTINDVGAIWGVNSSGTGSGVGEDGFGAVAFLHKPVCRVMYDAEPHNWCLTGAPLIVPPVGCEDSQNLLEASRRTFLAIRAVCAADASCCDPASAWDDHCVAEGHSLVGNPPGCAISGSVLVLDGFENRILWKSTQAALALDADLKTEGAFGMDVGGSGYRVADGPSFRTPLWPPNASVGIDFFLPGGQPNPYWLGAVQMYATCPSANLFNAYLGQVELTGKPTNAFSTLSFSLPPNVQTVLMNEQHSDCFFSIAVNTNATPVSPVVDNLRLLF